MVSTRAQEVAEVLWELKRADKVATFSDIAGRAGFSAGTKGRTMMTCLKTVRRDWPHLQWWRAINDDGLIEGDSEHATMLSESGIELSAADGKDDRMSLTEPDDHLMDWKEPEVTPDGEEAVV